MRLRPFHWPFNRPLTPTNSHLHLTDGVQVAGRKGAPHVLSRASCRFRHIAFGDLPRRDRMGYLQVQLLAWSPFGDSEFGLVMGEMGAAVFAWDRTAFVQRCEAAGLSKAPGRVMAEGLLRPALASGIRLHRCIEGIEGQFWRDGALVASRWWPEAPDAAAWLNFQRGAGVPPQQQSRAIPEVPAGISWDQAPLGRIQRLSELLLRDRLQELAGMAVVSLLLAAPTLWYAKSWWVVDAHVAALTQERTEIETASKGIREARAGALEAQATLDAMLAQVDRPSPTALLSHLSRSLPKDGSVLRELDWKGAQVRLVLAPPPGTARITYVEALEGGGWLKNVRELPAEGGDGVTLAAELADIRPPAPAPAGEAGAAPETAPDDAARAAPNREGGT